MMAENCKDDWRYTALNALSVKEWDSRNGRKAHKSSYIILIDIRASDLPARGNIVMQQLVSAFYQDKTDLTGPGADLVHSTILTPFYSTSSLLRSFSLTKTTVSCSDMGDPSRSSFSDILGQKRIPISLQS